MASAIEISHDEQALREPGGVALGGLGAAVAIAQEDTHAGILAHAVAVIGHGNVEDAVPVEVPHGHLDGSGPRGEVAGQTKPTLPWPIKTLTVPSG